MLPARVASTFQPFSKGQSLFKRFIARKDVAQGTKNRNNVETYIAEKKKAQAAFLQFLGKRCIVLSPIRPSSFGFEG